MRNLRLDICYDGSKYRGWQRLPGSDLTIQGKLEKTLSRILGEEIEIVGSGRTDSGVHAVRQVANFHCYSQMPAQEILQQLRRYLPSDIGIYSVRDVSERFHARLNAKSKVYRYRIWCGQDPCVFERNYVTALLENLDIKAMQQAAEHLVGTHDFSAFCANKHFKKSTIRTIFDLNVSCDGNEVVFTIKGNGFLHNMVRIIVGTLVEVGQGVRSAESISELFGQERAKAGICMPPQGLCLMEVGY